MYQCSECDFTIEVVRCPECVEACPVCGAELVEW